MAEMTALEVRRSLVELKAQLEAITKKDAEQEVRGIAVQPLDALLTEARRHAGDNPVVEAVRDVIHLDDLGGAPHRAVDVLLVVTMLLGALPPEPPAPRAMPRAFGPR